MSERLFAMGMRGGDEEMTRWGNHRERDGERSRQCRNIRYKKRWSPYNGGTIDETKMTQEERWLKNYHEVVAFIDGNKRRPSKYAPEERNAWNWLRHNQKLYNNG